MGDPNPITSHVLDTALGRPAQGLPITFEYDKGNNYPGPAVWVPLASGQTDADGRFKVAAAEDNFKAQMGGEVLLAGRYRATFNTGHYHGDTGFYPEVTVVFVVRAPGEHYHIPLLLSPFGYSTYRGS